VADWEILGDSNTRLASDGCVVLVGLMGLELLQLIPSMTRVEYDVMTWTAAVELPWYSGKNRLRSMGLERYIVAISMTG
jgi:hypothetical protein